MTYVQLEPGHFALSFGNAFGPWYDLSESAHTLANSLTDSSPCGFDEKAHNIEIYLIERVTPKTFVGYLGLQLRGTNRVQMGNSPHKRLRRSNVIACAPSLDAAIALKGKLLAIGVEADALIEAQIEASADIQSMQEKIDALTFAIIRDVREAARDRVQKSLPGLFGGRDSA